MALFLLLVAAELGVAAWDDQLQLLFGAVEQTVANTAFLATFALLIILSLAAESPTLKKPALLLGALVILGLFLKSGSGTFSQIVSAITNPGQIPQAQNAPTPSGNPTVSVSLGGSSPASALNSIPGISGLSNAINNATGGFFSGLF
jgi:hypothetical protein